MSRKRLGELLIELGLIDDLQLQSALGHQRQWGGRLGAVLVQMRFLQEEGLLRVLSRQLNLPLADPPPDDLHPRVLAEVPLDLALKHHIFPLGLKRESKGDVILIAMTDPGNVDAVDEVQFKTGKRVQVLLAGDSAVETWIRRHYQGEKQRSQVSALATSTATSAATMGVQFGGQDVDLGGGDDDIPVLAGTLVGQPQAQGQPSFAPAPSFAPPTPPSSMPAATQAPSFLGAPPFSPAPGVNPFAPQAAQPAVVHASLTSTTLTPAGIPMLSPELEPLPPADAWSRHVDVPLMNVPLSSPALTPPPAPPGTPSFGPAGGFLGAEDDDAPAALPAAALSAALATASPTPPLAPVRPASLPTTPSPPTLAGPPPTVAETASTSSADELPLLDLEDVDEIVALEPPPPDPLGDVAAPPAWSTSTEPLEALEISLESGPLQAAPGGPEPEQEAPTPASLLTSPDTVSSSSPSSSLSSSLSPSLPSNLSGPSNLSASLATETPSSSSAEAAPPAPDAWANAIDEPSNLDVAAAVIAAAPDVEGDSVDAVDVNLDLSGEAEPEPDTPATTDVADFADVGDTAVAGDLAAVDEAVAAALPEPVSADELGLVLSPVSSPPEVADDVNAAAPAPMPSMSMSVSASAAADAAAVAAVDAAAADLDADLVGGAFAPAADDIGLSLTPVLPEPPPAADELCPRCSNTRVAGSKFCPFCGLSFSASLAMPSSTMAAASSLPASPTELEAAASTESEPTESEEAAPEAKRLADDWADAAEKPIPRKENDTRNDVGWVPPSREIVVLAEDTGPAPEPVAAYKPAAPPTAAAAAPWARLAGAASGSGSGPIAVPPVSASTPRSTSTGETEAVPTWAQAAPQTTATPVLDTVDLSGFDAAGDDLTAVDPALLAPPPPPTEMSWPDASEPGAAEPGVVEQNDQARAESATLPRSPTMPPVELIMPMSFDRTSSVVDMSALLPPPTAPSAASFAVPSPPSIIADAPPVLGTMGSSSSELPALAPDDGWVVSPTLLPPPLSPSPVSSPPLSSPPLSSAPARPSPPPKMTATMVMKLDPAEQKRLLSLLLEKTELSPEELTTPPTDAASEPEKG